MEFNQEVFTRAFMAAMQAGLGSDVVQRNAMKQATVATGSTFNLTHGPGGYLGGVAVGIEPDVVSAMMAWRGIGDILPIQGTRMSEVLLPFITGVDAISSTEPQTECADCIAGETEACIQHFPLGRVCRETQTMTPDRIIERLNRGDIDLNLINSAITLSDSPWHPMGSFAQMGGAALMQVATAWALLFELPPLFMMSLSPMVYNGNPTNNINNAYREFRGANLLINTGHRDAFTNVLCGALDSDVKNFNHGNVTTATNPTLYQTMEMMEYFVWHNADRQRLLPATWAISMRPELWQILSGLIPLQAIQSALLGSTIPGSHTVNLDAATIVQERDRFRAGMIIPLNGRNYRVITDDGIAELNNANNANYDAGEYGSDLYFWPISYLGNRPATKIEYKDFRFMGPEIRATEGLIGDFYKFSPDGRFAYTWVKTSWCFKIQAKIEPRLILRVPQLAGRIQNIKYVPLQHLRSPDQESPYFAKGGVSTRAPTTYYY